MTGKTDSERMGLLQEAGADSHHPWEFETDNARQKWTSQISSLAAPYGLFPSVVVVVVF